ncbi:terminase large subunit [Zavarzinia compransoris]|uniref:terminase large subunit domain-containing protein n=1 Tax=Zavarzinia marina TaxID=2911065 RepID=UPI001F1D7A7F|nr:terminase family protein [Zavarzinia marina]MCF4166346.1 terminase large subunit [Zavarzinia marina]
MPGLSEADRAALLARVELELTRRKWEMYRPYARQREFHAAGATYRERLLRAGNQLGKSYAGAFEAVCHATGRYPDWWEGRRWTSPTTGWCGGVTGEVTRDTIQRLLIGAVGQRGTGMVPRAEIADVLPSRGVADLADTIMVKHESGGVSRIRLKYYEQGREKWQGDTVDWVWFDEEPPPEIYTEGLTRTNATGGMAWLTFTPLLGMSEVVRRFLMEESPDRSDTNMTIEDAEHIPAEERARIIASYPAHEREARTKGVPILGSGRIFPVAEELITVEPFVVPEWWPQLGGLDFGWDHPTAAVSIAWDRDADVIYVTRVYRRKEATPVIHAAALRPWGDWLPWAWPHDGYQHDKGSGEALKSQYTAQGMRMLAQHAAFEDGSNGVEAGLMEMLDRMETGRLRVFAHLADWFDEFRLYHRKDGRIVKEHDDTMDATRYAIMARRFATTPPREDYDTGEWRHNRNRVTGY